METNSGYFIAKILGIYSALLILHFLLLRYRLPIYGFCCELLRNRIRFFELPYFGFVFLLYSVMFFLVPYLLGIVLLDQILTNNDVIMYVLFGFGATIASSAISGFDIYPVNSFGTKEALQNLIYITRDLMKVCNRSLVLVTGSLVVGWVFGKVQLSPTAVYLTVYGVAGFAVGATAVLGSRLTELLYNLSELEHQVLSGK